MRVKISSSRIGAMMENSSALAPRSLREERGAAGLVCALLDLIGVALDDALDDAGHHQRQNNHHCRDDGPFDGRCSQLVTSFAPCLRGFATHGGDNRPCVEELWHHVKSSRYIFASPT